MRTLTSDIDALDKVPFLPVGTAAVATLLTVALMISLAMVSQRDAAEHSSRIRRATRSSAVAARVLHLDEVLTMSARMAAATGEEVWIDRYRGFETELDQLIQEAKTLAPTTDALSGVRATNLASEKLARMEHAAFVWIRQGKREQAWSLLNGPEYAAQKGIYARGTDAFVREMACYEERRLADYQRDSWVLVGGLCVGTFLMLTTWHLALRRVATVWRAKAERHQADAAALRLSEDRLSKITRSANDGIAMMDVDGRICFWNLAAEKMFGYSCQEVQGLPLHRTLAPPRFHAAYENGFARFRASGAGPAIDRQVELTALRKDGEEFPIELSLSAVQSDNGWESIGIIRDITQRKRSQEQLRTSERRYRALFEGTRDAVMLLDEKGFLECNEPTLRIFGFPTRQEFLAKHPGEVSPPIQPDGQDSRAAADQRIAHALRNGTAHFEWRHRRKDGTVFPADVLLSRVDLEDRTILQAVVRDITESKRNEQQLVYLASHDALTGLPNRRTFEEALTRAVTRAGRGTPSAVMLFDVDHFKAVNDTLGHAAGDAVLRELASIVRDCLRGEDILARLGGDELVALMEGVDLSEALTIAERARQAVADSDALPSVAPHPTLSVGLTRVEPEDLPISVLTRADAAMYEAKQGGRNRTVPYGQVTCPSQV